MRNIMRAHTYLLLLFSLVVGTVFSVFLFGIGILDVTNVDWIIQHDSDLSFGYVSWEIWRNEPWTFPVIGTVNSIHYPFGNAIPYLDMIPFLSIPLKLFTNSLPERFQYFGILSVFIFSMQFFFAVKIIVKFSRHYLLAMIAALFFVCLPTMIGRLFGHAALACHFVILAGLLLMINQRYDAKSIFYWAVLNVFTIFSQAYFLPMTMALFAGYLWNYIFVYKKWKFILNALACTVVVLLFFGWILGYFAISGTTGDYPTILSDASMNLNAFFNPKGGSLFLKDLMVHPVPFGDEGSKYLGLSIIILLIFSLFVVLENPKKYLPFRNILWGIVLASFLTFLYALGTDVYLGDKLLFKISVPRELLRYLSVWRSNNRLGWVSFYVVYVFSFSCFFIFFRKRYFLLLFLTVGLFVLQIYEFSGMFGWLAPLRASIKLEERSQQKVLEFRSTFWNMIPSNFKHLCVIPYEHSNSIELAVISKEKNWTLSSLRTSRADLPSMQEYAVLAMQKLSNGMIERDTIYIMAWSSHDFVNIINSNDSIDVFLVDGFFVILPKNTIKQTDATFFKIKAGNPVKMDEYLENVDESAGNLYFASFFRGLQLPEFFANLEIRTLFNELGIPIESMTDIKNGDSLIAVFAKPDSGVPVWKYGAGKNIINSTSYDLRNGMNVLMESALPFGGNVLIDGVQYSINWNEALVIVSFDAEKSAIRELAIFDAFWDPNKGSLLTFYN